MDIGIPLYLCDDVRGIDRDAIQSDGIAGFELMTRAAQAALDLLRKRWPDAKQLLIACGPGNNGGDGFVLARLARAAGLRATVIFLASTTQAGPDASRAAREWEAAGGESREFDPTDATLPGCDLIVDAIFGIGLTRAPQDDAAALITAINLSPAPVLALDVPSGLDSDRGSAPGVVVQASTTLVFIAHKRGMHTGVARQLCGALELATLDVPAATRQRRDAAAWRLEPGDLAHWLRPRPRHAHKGDHGRVLAVGGDDGYAGAIRLCAEAALRGGAGRVSVATRASNLGPIVTARPECMPRAVRDGDDLAPMLQRADVIALGPGLGLADWGRALFAAALATQQRTVIDADALTLLAGRAPTHAEVILTPHPGEAARLLDVTVAAIERDRFAAADAIARQYQAVVILKGAGSIVAAPARAPALIGAGNPGMASGGMGDVLTGIVAALWAQGLDRFDAARAAALLHAAAGDVAAQDGERGLLATDLFEPLQQLANPL